MFKQLLELIESNNPIDRIAGWGTVRKHCARLRSELSREQFFYLLNLYGSEQHPLVLKESNGTLFALVCDLKEEPAALTGDPPIFPWFWKPFHQKSIVFSTTSQDHHRRDEFANLHIGRQLCRHEYGETDFWQIPVRKDSWQEKLSSQPYMAVCLLGRLGLYGNKRVVKKIANRHARFQFPKHQRARNAGEETKKKYYSLVEVENNKVVEEYYSDSHDGIRTDYAVVQRYTTRINTRNTVVINCAGTKSLGTLAAARWASWDLAESVDHQPGKFISAPDWITQNSCLEVLLEVQAKETTDAWRIKNITPLKLFLDDRPWSIQEHAWQNRNIQLITICGGEHNPSGVLFDGKPARTKKSGVYNRIIAALARLRKEDGTIEMEDLLKEENLWGSDEADERAVMKKLSELKYIHLKDALDTNSGIKLVAKVEFKRSMT